MPPAGTTAREGSRMNERIDAIAVREKYYVFATFERTRRVTSS